MLEGSHTTLLSQEHAAVVFLPPLIEELCEALEELYAGSVPASGGKDIKIYLVIAQMSFRHCLWVIRFLIKELEVFRGGMAFVVPVLVVGCCLWGRRSKIGFPTISLKSGDSFGV